MRSCKRCERTEEEVTFPKDSGYADGVSRLCKDCKNARARGEWKLDTLVTGNPIKKRYCKTCNRTPVEVTFEKNKLNRDGLDNMCVECAKVRDSIYMKRYYERHTEVIRARVDKYQKAHPEKAREGYRRRQLHIREGYIEVVNDLVVFERDSWTCQICGDVVDATIKWPSMLSASLDHIIPLSKGGEHSYANTRLAHLGCNVQKSDKLT